MKIEKLHIIGISIALAIVLVDYLLFADQRNLFMFMIGIAFFAGLFPFVIATINETKKSQEMDEMFLEFSRNLSESVSTGTPISKSIVNMASKNYGVLTPHVQKLGNQISLGVPVNAALLTFAEETESSMVKRAVGLISEAQKAGGEIENILEAVAKSISEVEKLKKERKATIYNLIVQGYIIFLIFIGIMLVMEFKILPMTSGIGASSSLLGGGISANAAATSNAFSSEDLSNLLLYLLVSQGLCTGLVIGKLAEGSVKAGIKHSFIMTIAAILLSTGARLIFA